jgi:hypothetical protein
VLACTRVLVGFRRHIRGLTVLVLALTLVGTAISASSGDHFRGKTKGGFSVTFSTTATKVVGFKTTVVAFCTSTSSSSSSRPDVYPLRMLQSPHPLAKGQFKLTFGGKSSTSITVTGLVKASSASGRIIVSYEKTLGTTPEGMLNLGLCSAKTTWTAKKA